jgi:hypothetical protein
MALTGKPTPTTAVVIDNDGFWPDVELKPLLDDYRIPASDYNDNVIRTGLTLSIIGINAKLANVKSEIISLGYNSLVLYTTAFSSTIDNKEVLHQHYFHAVYCRAKAYLLMQFNSLNRKPNAENQAKESPETEQYWLDQSQNAIYLLTEAIIQDSEIASQNGFLATLI